MNNFKPLTNNLRKVVISLKDKKTRDEEKLFLIEGIKLCKELLESNFQCEFIILKSNSDNEIIELAELYEKKSVPIYIARKAQFENLSDTKSPQDIIAIAKMEESTFKIDSSFIALDGVNDPGNLGTIIRTADWFGYKHIVLGNNSVDRFNPKTVRSTMGSLFRINIHRTDNLSEFLKNQNSIITFGATLETNKYLEDYNISETHGLIFGSEANGISKDVMKLIDHPFKIKGFGAAESLNVAVSVGISLYYFSSKK